MFYLFTILISVFVAIYQNKYNSEYYTQKNVYHYIDIQRDGTDILPFGSTQ